MHPAVALMTVCGFASSGPFSFTSLPQRRGEWLELEGGEGMLGYPEQKWAGSPAVGHQIPFGGRTYVENRLMKILPHIPSSAETIGAAALSSFRGARSICRGW